MQPAFAPNRVAKLAPAIDAVIDDLASHQRHLTAAVVAGAQSDHDLAVESWISARKERIEPLRHLIEEVESGGAGIAQLAVANRHLRELVPK